MKRRISSILILFCLNITLGLAQETRGFKIPDSLKGKSYEYLYNRIYQAYPDTTKYLMYSHSYLEKSRNEGRKINMARAYGYISYFQKEDKLRPKYLDSAIAISKNSGNPFFPTLPYSFKAGYYMEKSNFEKALEYFSLSLEEAERYSNDYYVYSAKYNIGSIKNVLGRYDEALQAYKESLEYFEGNIKSMEDSISYMFGILDISVMYSRKKMTDSSSFYIKKGKRLSKKISSSKKNFHLDHHFVFLEGINNFNDKNYVTALDSINKTLAFLNNPLKDYTLDAYFYLGKIYNEMGEKDKAHIYYQKIDSAHQSSGRINVDLRDANSSLLSYYRDKGDTQKQLLHIEKLLKIDSVLYQNHKVLDKKMILEYDTPNLLKAKEEIIASLEAEKNTSTSQKAIISLLLVLSLGGGGYYYYTQRQYKRRFLQMLDATKQDEEKIIRKETTKDKSDTLSISQETLDHLLAQLQRFEDNQGYLKPKINAKDLAKSFDSNSSYLSVVINTYKQKSISQYINDLRIDFAIQKLKEDPKFRKYTIKAIAQESGFNTSEAFSKTFYKKTKIYPSYFIKSLEKQN